MIAAALSAFALIMEPARLAIMFGGVLLGLSLGVIPGLGGIVGLALLIPFTTHMDAYSAFALLLGMASVTTVSDLIPAVLFGVPGSVGAAATVLDGYPLARRGEAARAFGAGYAASLAGGVFGALLLALAIPVLRPAVLYVGSAELLSFCIFGLSMIAVLSGKALLRGLAAACIGLMLSMIGSDPETGTLRWTFDTLYLWDHLPLVPVTLGIFAVPELADIAIRRLSIAGGTPIGETRQAASQWDGVRDVGRHWWLVLRCSGLGAVLGAVPGMGSAVIDWIAYGHAVDTEKHPETFGTGDIRGVIAAEASNNAKEGGHLVPTIAFGVPAGASMALLLSAFLLHGFTPGPDMLTKHLDVTYSIIWTLTVSHIMGAAVCLCASGVFAKLARIRVGLLVPAVLAIVFIGAFNGSQAWGDIFAVAGFGVVGWVMKQLGWPRPPLILGIVLGGSFERYLFISTEVYGWATLARPIVIVVLLGALWIVLRPVVRASPQMVGGVVAEPRLQAPRLSANAGFAAVLIVGIVAAAAMCFDWPVHARLVPLAASGAALLFCTGALLTELFAAPRRAAAMPVADNATLDLSGPDGAVLRLRAWRFFAWLGAMLLAMAGIGVLPGLVLSAMLLAWIEFRERFRTALRLTLALAAGFWLLFDRVFMLPWPPAVLGDVWPWLRSVSGLV